MNWSQHTWKVTQPVFKAITEMAFIKELADGSLPREKFLFYISQDDIYLQGYARALAMIAARATDPKEVAAFTKFAQLALVSEQAMHDQFFAADTPLATGGDIQPACHHYVSYLLSAAATEPLEVAMAAVLPCFWIYREVGRHIHALAQANAVASVAENPYRAWIDTYAGEEFDELVDEAIELCDGAAERSTSAVCERMTAAYAFAARLEYDFWDAGYTLRRWGARLARVNSEE